MTRPTSINQALREAGEATPPASPVAEPVGDLDFAQRYARHMDRLLEHSRTNPEHFATFAPATRASVEAWGKRKSHQEGSA